MHEIINKMHEIQPPLKKLCVTLQDDIGILL